MPGGDGQRRLADDAGGDSFFQDSGHLSVSHPEDGPADLGADATNEANGGQLFVCTNFSGTCPNGSVIAKNLDVAVASATDFANVYLLTASALESVSKNPGADGGAHDVTTLVSPLMNASALAVDNVAIYYATFGTQAQGYAIPDSFTHGSSAQRQRWFETGLKSGNVQACNTFAASAQL